MPIDPGLVGLAVAVVTGLFTWLGVRTSNKGNLKTEYVKVTSDLFGEYRNLKDEIKEAADEQRERMEARLAEEQAKREEFEQRLTDKFDEVIIHFGIYVEWAKAGAKPPAPFIPQWIYEKISQVFKLED